MEDLTDYLDRVGICWTPVSKLVYSNVEGDFIMMDTNKVHQLDFDDEYDLSETLKKECPYYLSINRNLPHIFCLLDFEGVIGRVSYKKIDYLKGTPIFARRDAKVFNADKPIRKLIFTKSNNDPPRTDALS